MSKGKYLEFHDLDSIVKIGSFSFHVKKKQITGYSVQETKFSEATLRPEIISRWFSPDPLSDEFTSWTPYHFVHNNPINLIDPDGRAAMPPDDIFNNSQTNQLSVIKTNDSFDRIIIDGKYTGNAEKGITQASYKEKGYSTNEVNITYGKNANQSSVSDFSTSVVIDVMNESNNSSIQVNSTARTPEDQARIMSEKVKSGGMKSQTDLYGAKGDKVLSLYPDRKAMVNKINELQGQPGLNHVADPSKINVLDISPFRGGIKNPRDLTKAAQNNKSVSRVFSPYGKPRDPAIHIEIPQKK